MSKQPPAILTIEEAIDRYDVELDEFIQDAVWSDSFSASKACDLIARWAKQDGFVITDWEFAEDALWNLYQCTEKGLS